MFQLILSAARHLSGAAAAALVSLLASSDFFSAVDLVEVGEGADALVFGAALGAYALVEKALKPIFLKHFGSTGA